MSGWDARRDTPPPTPEALAKRQATVEANREAWQAKFLDALAENGGIARPAARSANIHYRTVFRNRAESQADPEKHVVAWPRGEDSLPFHEAWDLALAMARDLVEAEVHRRAVVGVERELTYQGRRTGDKIREWSDILLIFRMKKLDPSFRDNHTVDVNVGGRVEIESSRDKLAAKLLDAISRREAAGALAPADPATAAIDATLVPEALPAAHEEKDEE